MSDHERDYDLPPQVPETLADIERTVMLLGSRGHAELTKAHQAELTKLIGTYPSKKKAARWKIAIKALAKEMRAMGDTAPKPKKQQKAPPAPKPRRLVVEMGARSSQRVFRDREFR